MTFTNQRPLSVDGVRLDTYAYNIESLDGRRRLPNVRSNDVAVPGRHGVVPSLNDDFEPGSIVLRMWVRSSDVNDHRAPTKHPKDLLSDNLDRLFELFRPAHRLLDVRQQVGPSSVERPSWLANPRMDKSSSTSNVRSNLIVNPSMDRSTSTFVFRTNLIVNPSFEVNTTGWAGLGATLLRQPLNTAIDGETGDWRLDFTTTSTTDPHAFSSAMPVTVGRLYAASAFVGSKQLFGIAGTEPRVKIGIRWMDSLGATISQTFSLPEECRGEFTLGGFVAPSWKRLFVSDEAPVGATQARLIVQGELNEDGDPIPVGSIFCVDGAVFEEPAYDDTYFDGSSTGYGTVAWTGTAHNSVSQAIRATVDNWQVTSGRAQIFLSGADTDPAFGERCLVWRAVDTFTDEQPLLWQFGTMPNDNLAALWAASVYVQTEMADPPKIALRIAGLDSSNNFVAYATATTSASSDPAEKVIESTRGWRRYILNAAKTNNLPASVVKLQVRIVALEDVPEGSMFLFDAATLEAAPATPFYFDGDSGDTPGLKYVWDSTADNSWSRMQGGSVDDWTATRGTLVHDASLEVFPSFAARACGKYTVTSNAGAFNTSNFVVSDTTFGKPGTHWNGGAWVWGGGQTDIAQVAIESFNGGSSVSLTRGPQTDVNQGGWVWVPGPDHLQPDNTDRVRMVIYVWKTGQVFPGIGGVAYMAGGTLCHGSEPVDYFDELSPGVQAHSGGKFVKLPDVRKATCKTVAAAEPTDVKVAADGSLTQWLSFSLEIPDVFWQEVDYIVWQSPLQPSNNLRTYDVPNLAGSTAPLEDLVFVVSGPGSNCKVVDPETGWFVKLNGWLPKGQSWRVDVGRGLSGVAKTGTAWNSPAWRSVLGRTDYESGRQRMFSLSPTYDKELGYDGNERGYVCRLSMYGGISIWVRGRRKWL